MAILSRRLRARGLATCALGRGSPICLWPRAFFSRRPSGFCRAARFFSSHSLHRWVNGEMGQLLADPAFFAVLPLPQVRTPVFAGTARSRARADDEVIEVPALHNFIMNSHRVAEGIVEMAGVR